MCYSDPGKAGQFKDLALTQTLSKQRSDVKLKKEKNNVIWFTVFQNRSIYTAANY